MDALGFVRVGACPMRQTVAKGWEYTDFSQSGYFKICYEEYQYKNLIGRALLQRRDKSQFFSDVFTFSLLQARHTLLTVGRGAAGHTGTPPRPGSEVALG